MEAVSRLIRNGLRREIRVQSVSGSNGLHHGAEGHGIIRGAKGIGIPEIDLILLDVRTQEEYDEEHIPGAVCLPNEMIAADMPFPFGKDAEILVYCRSGRRSAEAAKKLRDMGFTNVSDFGGIIDWPYETTTD